MGNLKGKSVKIVGKNSGLKHGFDIGQIGIIEDHDHISFYIYANYSYQWVLPSDIIIIGFTEYIKLLKP